MNQAQLLVQELELSEFHLALNKLQETLKRKPPMKISEVSLPKPSTKINWCTSDLK